MLQPSILISFTMITDKLVCFGEEIKTSFPPPILPHQIFANSTLSECSLLE